MRHAAIFHRFFAQTKIGQFDVSVRVQQNVLRFQITVKKTTKKKKPKINGISILIQLISVQGCNISIQLLIMANYHENN